MTRSPAVQDWVSALHAAEYFSAIDVHFSRTLFSSAGMPPADGGIAPSPQALAVLQLAAALTSRYLREGHVCAPLSVIAGTSLETATEPVVLPSLSQFRAALESSSRVFVSSQATPAEPDGQLRQAVPLVLGSGDRLYFHRYDEHERRLAAALTALNRPRPVTSDDALALERLFPDGASDRHQRRAAEAALSSGLSVISGGPGTGKTTTVVRILALLVERAVREGVAAPRILLMAPTGKAAARLGESIRSAKGNLGLSPEVCALIPELATTIHRALGVSPQSRTRFRHGPDEPLSADVVLVDEASMVDLSLMRHLVEATPTEGQLILLGDRHQLASVEAGSVLSELCQALGEVGAPSGSGRSEQKAPERARQGAGASAPVLVELQRSYRFAEDSGIFAAARSVREGNSGALFEVVAQAREDCQLIACERPLDSPEFKRLVVSEFRAALRQTRVSDVLSALEGFRVLAGHRRGPYGVEDINEQIRRWLVEAAVVPPGGPLYRGRVILVTKNDAGVGLNNGDIGVVWPEADGRLAVFFPVVGGPPRALSPAHLPEHETAFAMTIHKSQGSEYNRVAVVLPGAGSPLLTRELVYTGITRAKEQVRLFGSVLALEASVSGSVRRYGGLKERVQALGSQGASDTL